LGFMVGGLGFKIYGSGFRIWGNNPVRLFLVGVWGKGFEL